VQPRGRRSLHSFAHPLAPSSMVYSCQEPSALVAHARMRRKALAPRSGPTAIKLILDNHSAHISKETRAWLADQPAGRFEFTITPKHGSWLNLEGFFSKLARSIRRIRVMAAMDLFNQDPVVHTWSYKLDRAA
jgi:DDE superfamily endonuclease